MAEISSLWIVALRALVSCLLSVGDFPWFLPRGPHRRAAHSVATCFIKASMEEGLSGRGTLQSYVTYVITDIPLPIGSKASHRTHPQSRADNSTKARIQRSRDHWALSSSLSASKIRQETSSPNELSHSCSLKKAGELMSEKGRRGLISSEDYLSPCCCQVAQGSKGHLKMKIFTNINLVPTQTNPSPLNASICPCTSHPARAASY